MTFAKPIQSIKRTSRFKLLIVSLMIVASGVESDAYSQGANGNGQVLKEVTDAKQRINCATVNTAARACKEKGSCDESKNSQVASDYMQCLARMATAIEEILAQPR